MVIFNFLKSINSVLGAKSLTFLKTKNCLLSNVFFKIFRGFFFDEETSRLFSFATVRHSKRRFSVCTVKVLLFYLSFYTLGYAISLGHLNAQSPKARSPNTSQHLSRKLCTKRISTDK